MKHLILFSISLLFSYSLSAGTFDEIITIFESKCQSCHNPNDMAADLDLTGTKDELYERLFENESTNAFSTAYGYNLVDAGYPERSTLYRSVNDGLYHNVVLEGTENGHWEVETDILDWEKELIRQWIFHGAKKTGNTATGRKETLISYYEEGGIERMERPEPPAEGEGFQLYLGTIFLEPNEEWEMVYNYKLNNEEAFEVNRIDVKMSDFSHHFLFFDYFNDNHENVGEGFRTVDYINIIAGNSINLGESGTTMISGWAYSKDVALPVGTAYKWEEDLVLKFNYHIKNYSTTQVYPSDLYVNIYTQETGTAIKEMYSDFLINGEQFVTSSIPSTCDTIVNTNRRTDFGNASSSDSLHIWNLGAHTHQLGVDYDIYRSGSSGEKLEQVYEGMYNYDFDYDQGFYDYAEPTFRFFDDYLSIKKGDGLIQEGKFVNCTGSNVGYGLTTNDEMLGFFTQYLVGDLTELIAYQDSIANVTTTNNTIIADKNLDFSIRPNPNDGNFVIHSEIIDNNSQIEIVDVTGKIIYSESLKNNDQTIDISSNPSGIYFAKVTDNKGNKFTRKIIKY